MSKNTNQKETPEEILKRIEAQSSDQKRLETLRILNRKDTTAPQVNPWWADFRVKWRSNWALGKKQLFKNVASQENRHIAIITTFFLGAIFISWKIEDKYDKMRKRIRDTKSTKEKQVESENQYINRMLLKNPFEAVPIEDEVQDKPDYIFQKAEMQFDTSADLMEAVEREGGGHQ